MAFGSAEAALPLASALGLRAYAIVLAEMVALVYVDLFYDFTKRKGTSNKAKLIDITTGKHFLRNGCQISSS